MNQKMKPQNEMKRQYLFNPKLFEENWAQVPAILCFPMYFFLSVSTVLNNYIMISFKTFEKKEESAIRTLINGWFHILSPLIFTLIRKATGSYQSNICLLPPSRFHDILWDASQQYKATKKTIPVELLTLEHYIANDDGKQIYQQILNSTNIQINKTERLCDLVKYLTMTGCCPKVDTNDHYIDVPDSLHYTPFTTDTYPNSLRRGPAGWGPYYWKIFHDIVSIPPPPPTSADECLEYTYMLDSFPSILPLTVPCLNCQINYFNNIQPSTIPTSVRDHDDLYSLIHNRVSKHTNTPKPA